MSEGRALWSGAEAELGASKLAEISRAIVALYKEQFGRGPTRVRSDFAGPDTLICTLKDTFTPSEHRLAQMGEHQRLAMVASTSNTPPRSGSAPRSSRSSTAGCGPSSAASTPTATSRQRSSTLRPARRG